ncbi:4-hydroxy-3-methylbut-2-enyl diphosphate reductase [Streptomyces sp. NPDC007346]|uniref:4-hydroxy-3-methylbut-2-enyl diphosphate reductase n=1 Tax=Streptomyces sp. NPDC007346 TaxID=3154682 RepID=UPI003452AF2B
MNRSKRSDVFLSTSLPVAPGALAVATAWWHPLRGPMDCPAHPLLTAHARQAGFAVDARPWEEAAVNGDDRGPAGTTVVAVSYERPEGGHRGIALAARSEDSAAVAFAHRQIASWQAVLRTRRVLYVNEETAPPAHPTPTTSVLPTPGPHTPGLPNPGLHTPEPHTSGLHTPAPHTPAPHAPAPPQARGGAVGAWLPCGCPAASACPAAASAERSLHRSVARGDEVVVVGAPAAGTGGGWPSRAPAGTVKRAATEAQAETLTVKDPERLAFVIAPGAVVSRSSGILRVLRRRFPRLRGQHPWEWCYTTDDLDTAVGSVLGQSDALLVTGGGDSPLVRTALARAARSGIRTREVTSLDRLRPEDIDGATITVLHTATPEQEDSRSLPSCPEGTRSAPGRREGGGGSIRDVPRILDGLGPTGHIHRTVRSTALPSPFGLASLAPLAPSSHTHPHEATPSPTR